MHQGKITKLPDEKALTKRGISISPIENRELKATILFKIYCIISKIKKKNDLILEERIGSCVLFVRFFFKRVELRIGVKFFPTKLPILFLSQFVQISVWILIANH